MPSGVNSRQARASGDRYSMTAARSRSVLGLRLASVTTTTSSNGFLHV